MPVYKPIESLVNYLISFNPSGLTRKLERATRFELATPSLGSLYSTN